MGKGRAPCCDKSKVKRGPWSPCEDLRLIAFIQKHGHHNWRALPKQAGLLRCGKSCRLRWINYLRPDVKRGNFTKEEEDTIISLHQSLGNKWSKIASYLPGRTDNEIKNMWNTHLRKKLSPNLSPKESSSSHSSSSISSSSCANNNQEGESAVKCDGKESKSSWELGEMLVEADGVIQEVTNTSEWLQQDPLEWDNEFWHRLDGLESLESTNGLDGLESLGSSNGLDGLEPLGSSNGLDGLESLGSSNGLVGLESLGSSNGLDGGLDGLESWGSSSGLDGLEPLGPSNGLDGVGPLGPKSNGQDRVEPLGSRSNGVEPWGSTSNGQDGVEPWGSTSNGQDGMEALGWTSNGETNVGMSGPNKKSEKGMEEEDNGWFEYMEEWNYYDFSLMGREDIDPTFHSFHSSLSLL